MFHRWEFYLAINFTKILFVQVTSHISDLYGLVCLPCSWADLVFNGNSVPCLSLDSFNFELEVSGVLLVLPPTRGTLVFLCFGDTIAAVGCLEDFEQVSTRLLWSFFLLDNLPFVPSKAGEFVLAPLVPFVFPILLMVVHLFIQNFHKTLITFGMSKFACVFV